MPNREQVANGLGAIGNVLAWTVVGLGYTGFAIIFTDSMGWTHVVTPSTSAEILSPPVLEVPDPQVSIEQEPPKVPEPGPVEKPTAVAKNPPLDKTAELNLAELCKYADKTGTEEVCGVKYDVWESKTHDETYRIRARI